MSLTLDMEACGSVGMKKIWIMSIPEGLTALIILALNVTCGKGKTLTPTRSWREYENQRNL